MKKLLVVLCLGALSACGVDGEPTTPQPDVSAGVTINSSGIYPSVGLGFDAGLLRVWLGL
jgi:hypothetical protein